MSSGVAVDCGSKSVAMLPKFKFDFLPEKPDTNSETYEATDRRRLLVDCTHKMFARRVYVTRVHREVAYVLRAGGLGRIRVSDLRGIARSDSTVCTSPSLPPPQAVYDRCLYHYTSRISTTLVNTE